MTEIYLHIVARMADYMTIDRQRAARVHMHVLAYSYTYCLRCHHDECGLCGMHDLAGCVVVVCPMTVTAMFTATMTAWYPLPLRSFRFRLSSCPHIIRNARTEIALLYGNPSHACWPLRSFRFRAEQLPAYSPRARKFRGEQI